MALTVLAAVSLSVQSALAADTGHRTEIVLHGEIHGIAASLHHFVESAIEVSETRPVIAAFELPARGQSIIDDWWLSGATTLTGQDVQAMGWCALEDGRTSVELVGAIERLREAGQTNPITVSLIDRRFQRPSLQSMRDTSTRGSAELAIEIARLAARNPTSSIQVLMGNAHTRKQPMDMPEAFGGGVMITAGHLLADDVTSVAYAYEAGARAGCSPSDCGRSPVASNADAIERAGAAYDRVVQLGPAEPVTLLQDSLYCREEAEN